MWSTSLLKNKLLFIKNETVTTEKIYVTNKCIYRQNWVVQNLIMKGVIKVGINNILKQKLNNQYHATQHSPVANFLAANKTIFMHKQNILQLFNFFL